MFPEVLVSFFFLWLCCARFLNVFSSSEVAKSSQLQFSFFRPPFEHSKIQFKLWACGWYISFMKAYDDESLKEDKIPSKKSIIPEFERICIYWQTKITKNKKDAIYYHWSGQAPVIWRGLRQFSWTLPAQFACPEFVYNTGEKKKNTHASWKLHVQRQTNNNHADDE